MTLEEAKDYIREWCPYDKQEEIIKALEQDPCEDAVSRQAVLNLINENIRIDDDKLELIAYFVENMPSVKSNVNVDALINKIETEFSWSMYDDWGNSTDLHDGLVDIIREWAESENKECR